MTRSNGDVLPTLLVDGYVAGVWRPVDGGIEATAFHRLSAKAWEGLAAEARSLVALLAGRDPGSTDATTAGGPHCPAPRSGYSPGDQVAPPASRRMPRAGSEQEGGGSAGGQACLPGQALAASRDSATAVRA